MFENIPTPVMLAIATFSLAMLAIFGNQIKAFFMKGAPLVAAQLKEKIGPANWTMLWELGELAIRAAQQARLNEWIEDTGEAAREYAVAKLKALLVAQGFEEFDVDALMAIIDGVFNDIGATLKKTVEDNKPSQDAEVHG